MTEEWRLLILEGLPPLWTQLIWHASALYSCEIHKNILILNCTDGQLISCGYFQNIFNEINTKYCRKNRILYTKRMTGGGTVLLNQDQVFFNFIFYGYQFPVSFKLLYNKALKGPLEFYRSLNLNCNLNNNEIKINQKRISSSGIATIENTSVVVGNIIIDFDYNTFINALSLPTICFENFLRNNLNKYITSLNREDRYLSREEIIASIIPIIEKNLRIKLIEEKLSNWEYIKIKELENYYLFDTLNNFNKLNRKKNYLKIKNNVILIYFEPFNISFLIENRRIKAILPKNRAGDLLNLMNENINQIKYEKYSQLKKELIQCYQQCL